jgi:nicotinamide-nucleotide amidase
VTGPDDAGADVAGPVRLHRALLARGETVAAAESLTAGLFCATLASVPGASGTLRGGAVVYATDLKTALAGVPADLLAAHGPVSPETDGERTDVVRLDLPGSRQEVREGAVAAAIEAVLHRLR